MFYSPYIDFLLNEAYNRRYSVPVTNPVLLGRYNLIRSIRMRLVIYAVTDPRAQRQQVLVFAQQDNELPALDRLRAHRECTGFSEDGREVQLMLPRLMIEASITTELEGLLRCKMNSIQKLSEPKVIPPTHASAGATASTTLTPGQQPF